MAAKFKKIILENGTLIQTYVNKQTGLFIADCLGKDFRGPNFAELEKAILEYTKEAAKLEFYPVIQLESEGWCARTGNGFKHSREFHAKLVDGSIAVKQWIGAKIPNSIGHDDYIPGIPLGIIRKHDAEYISKEGESFIAYSVEKWKALEKISQQMDLLRKRLHILLTGQENELFLRHISDNTIKLLEDNN